MQFLIQIVTKLCHLEKFLRVRLYGYSKIRNKMEAIPNLNDRFEVFLFP